MKYNQPVVTTKGFKKYVVKVKDPITGHDKYVYFGDTRYEDFTQHHDLERRKNYLARSAGIRNKQGDFTKDIITSANYWSRRYLWASE